MHTCVPILQMGLVDLLDVRLAHLGRKQLPHGLGVAAERATRDPQARVVDRDAGKALAGHELAPVLRLGERVRAELEARGWAVALVSKLGVGCVALGAEAELVSALRAGSGCLRGHAGWWPGGPSQRSAKRQAAAPPALSSLLRLTE